MPRYMVVLLAFARKQTVAPKVLDVNETVAGMLKMLLRLIHVDVFRHDDSHVAHVADGDGETGQGHDIGIDAKCIHQDETERDRERQRNEHGNGAPQMKQEDENDRAGHEGFLGKGLFERGNGLLDDIGAVVEGNDFDL